MNLRPRLFFGRNKDSFDVKVIVISKIMNLTVFPTVITMKTQRKNNVPETLEDTVNREKASARKTTALTALLVTILFASSVTTRLGAAEAKPTRLSHKQLVELLKSAKEPQDHMKLAAYYKAEAQRLRQRAKEHKEMEELYANLPAGGGSSKRPMTSGVPHCDHWADLDLEEAKEAEALASMHEGMAKGAAQ